MSTTDASRLPPGRYYRKELVALLDHCTQVPLTLLLAPAGAGKSTLLSQWQARPDIGAVISLSLRPADDDPVRFLRRFAEGTRAVVPAFDTSWFMPFDVAELPPASIADALFDALEQVDEPLFIVFDDFQHIRSPETLSVISTLLAQPPGNVHLIIASRTQPAFDVSRLRLEDRLLEINAADLKIRREEVTALNAGLGGEALDDADMTHLLSITEGWMAGVKIALLAAIRSGMQTLQDFDASQPELMAYFGHAVLKGLPDTARTLFMQSALLDSFNAALCDEVLQSDRSARLIEELSSRELFLIPVAGQPGWYRYHALLRDFLRARVAIDMPDCITAIHRRATRFFVRHQNFRQAVWHAKRAGDDGLFIHSLEQAFDYWLREGYAAHILDWAETLPDDVILGRDELAAPLISTLTLSRRFFRARYYLDALKEAPRSGEAARDNHARVIDFLEMHLQLFQHDTDFMEGANLSLLMESCGHRDIRAFSLAMVAYHHLQHGRLESALAFSCQAREVLLRLGHRFTAGYAGLITALANHQLGHIGEAVAFINEHFHNTTRDCPTWSLWATGMVVVLYDQSRLTEAQQLCEDLLPMVSSASATEVISTVYLTLSRLQHLQGKHQPAERMLEKLLGILQLGNYERFVSMTVLEMVRQAFTAGHWARLDAVAERFDLAGWVADNGAHTPHTYSQSWERKGLAAAYWLIANGRLAEAEAVLQRLLAVVKTAGIKTRASIMEANLLVIASKQQPAAEQAKQVDALITRHGLLNINRSVFDEAPGLASLMNRLWRGGALMLPACYTELFPAVFDVAPGNDPLEVDPDSVLTPKELEIFELLQGGLSNALISEKTGTSITTTKWHLKNIYSKLGLSNRTEAVLRAAPR
ncbi:LuxR C-terminal-related transcriptional regulator [Alcanivorax sp. JB21]|uniref:LuxR C-terminal-related transcriptional regulator n=1 Tax=Alcanivorax limicola TaxID=2874102 RepID=UPI001CBF6251|nr:LuxR C-terminal-related transcriptional regulator [Alcanivorax limicola]MBZ2188866.1 LuxR C-terminal-related transcriptional regulator [Alcanivorax limicola]